MQAGTTIPTAHSNLTIEGHRSFAVVTLTSLVSWESEKEKPLPKMPPISANDYNQLIDAANSAAAQRLP